MGDVGMQSSRVLLFMAMILVFCLIELQAQQAPINCKGALSEEQLIGLLKAKVDDVRVQAIVKQCDVGFPLTSEAEHRLRTAGASDAVIASVRTKERERLQRAEEEKQRRAADLEEQQRDKLAREAAQEAKRREEEKVWESAKDSKSAERLGEYLRQFPEGPHASEARDKLSNLTEAEELRGKIRQAKEGGQWQEAEAALKELAVLLPEDEEMRSWKSWVKEERARWDSMTLAEAQGEFALLEKKVEEVRKTEEAARDVELKPLDEKYKIEREQAGKVDPQGPYETTAQYKARQARVQAALDDLESKQKAEREGIERRYAAEMERQSQGYLRQIEALKARAFAEEGAKIEFVSYSADDSRLAAKVNGQEYWFRIEPKEAEEFVPRLNAARVEQYLDAERAQERVLYDSAGEQGYTGVLRSKAERLLREELAPITWVDPKTRLMWAHKDNGLDVNWNEAMSYCQQLRLTGFSDWRLPEIGELEGIYDASVNQPYKVKGDIQLSDYWAWSATRQGTGEAWFFYFLNGGRASYLLDLRRGIRALCVRRSGE
jgi:hypothetical protein